MAYQPIDRPWNNPFSDVSEGDWYYEAVRFVHERGLMNGYSDGRFGPNDTLSRAQLAQILFNLGLGIVGICGLDRFDLNFAGAGHGDFSVRVHCCGMRY